MIYEMHVRGFTHAAADVEAPGVRHTTPLLLRMMMKYVSWSKARPRRSRYGFSKAQGGKQLLLHRFNQSAGALAGVM